MSSAAGDLRRALSALEAGGLVVIPTDTVYGVAAKLTEPRAIEALFRVKGRPDYKPIPVLAAGRDDLGAVADMDGRARRLADEFWPGPLSLVLPRARGFTVDLGGRGARGVAVRVPDRRLTLELLARTGPLAVTSANRSGEAPATTAAEARATLGDDVEVVVDDGLLPGSPSTVVSLVDDVEVLREGPIDASSVRRALSAIGPRGSHGGSS